MRYRVAAPTIPPRATTVTTIRSPRLDRKHGAAQIDVGVNGFDRGWIGLVMLHRLEPPT